VAAAPVTRPFFARGSTTNNPKLRISAVAQSEVHLDCRRTLYRAPVQARGTISPLFRRRDGSPGKQWTSGNNPNIMQLTVDSDCRTQSH
jgi:hypothetical protein